MGSLRVRHDWATSLSLFTFMHWRRKWQPTPVFLPGESQGRGSLVGCRLSMGSHRVRHDWSDSAAAAPACKTQPHENLSSIPQLAFHLSSLTYIMLYPVRNLDGSKWKKLSVYLTVMLNVNLIKLLVLVPAYSKYGRQRNMFYPSNPEHGKMSMIIDLVSLIRNWQVRESKGVSKRLR